MTRILRDHGKIIMTVLGVILMFVFALPTFRGMSPDDVGKMKVATLNGRTITNNDVRTAQAELSLLSELELLGSETPTGYSGSPDFERTGIVLTQFGGQQEERTTYWLLLTEEASKYAFTSVGKDDVMNLTARATPPGAPAVDVQTVLNNAGTGMVFARQAVSHLEEVEQYLSFLMSMGPRPVSSFELQGDADLRKVDLKFATIDGAADWQQAAEPTADQIGKQFDLYKHTVKMPVPPADAETPGSQPAQVDGHRYPFGYKYPDRVTVEYLEFNRAALRELIKKNLIQKDISDAYEYYKKNPQEFQSTTAPSTASAPATAPAATQPTTQPWETVQQQAVDRIIDKKTDIALGKIVQTAIGLAGDPWKNSATLPREKWAAYPEIATAISSSQDFFKYKPEYKSSEEGATADKRDKGLMGPEELHAIPGIGDSIYLLPVGLQQALVPFPVLATHVQDLVKSDPKDPLSRLNLQVGTEGPVTKDKDGNQYLYRVTTADPTHEPASVDEVKSQVVEDLKKRATYEKTVAAVKDALAKNPRVTAVAEQYKAKVETPDEFSRVDSPLPPEIRAIPDFVQAAFSIDQTAQSRPANITQPAPGTALLAVDSTLHCYPIELIKFTKPTGADFAKQLSSLIQNGDPALRQFIGQYLTTEALSGRLKYVPVTPPKKPATAPAGK